jgi:hypothetical protein
LTSTTSLFAFDTADAFDIKPRQQSAKLQQSLFQSHNSVFSEKKRCASPSPFPHIEEQGFCGASSCFSLVRQASELVSESHCETDKVSPEHEMLRCNYIMCLAVVVWR